MAVAVTVTTAVHAQYVTYNHDSPKQNQVTVMETGTGALSPDLYYSVLHNKYCLLYTSPSPRDCS